MFRRSDYVLTRRYLILCLVPDPVQVSRHFLTRTESLNGSVLVVATLAYDNRAINRSGDQPDCTKSDLALGLVSLIEEFGHGFRDSHIAGTLRIPYTCASLSR